MFLGSIPSLLWVSAMVYPTGVAPTCTWGQGMGTHHHLLPFKGNRGVQAHKKVLWAPKALPAWATNTVQCTCSVKIQLLKAEQVKNIFSWRSFSLLSQLRNIVQILKIWDFIPGPTVVRNIFWTHVYSSSFMRSLILNFEGMNPTSFQVFKWAKKFHNMNI